MGLLSSMKCNTVLVLLLGIIAPCIASRSGGVIEGTTSLLSRKFLKSSIKLLDNSVSRSSLQRLSASTVLLSVNKQEREHSLPWQREIQLHDQLTDEMDQLRLTCFPGPISLKTSRDQFDERSKHIAVYINKEIAAYGRLTPGPNSVFETWTHGKARIPTGSHIIDLGRCLVNPKYRGQKLFEIVCLKGLCYAYEQNYHYIIGTYLPGHHIGPRLHHLGFEDCGPKVLEDEPSEKNVLVQPVVYKVGRNLSHLQHIANQHSAFFPELNEEIRARIGHLLKADPNISQPTISINSDFTVTRPISRLDNKVALITGAAEGIGKATAQLFAQEGAKIIIADINDEEGLRVARDLGPLGKYIHLDVTQENEWGHVLQFIKDKYGKLDILVNNAGILEFEGAGLQNPKDCSLESWHRAHAVNLDGVFLGCKHAIPIMKDTGNASIINVSSRFAMVGMPKFAPYASSKAAVRNHTKTVALYCAQNNYGIRCNSVHPAAIFTSMWDSQLGQGDQGRKAKQEISNQIPLKRMGTPTDVAYGILYLASDESSYVTGIELTIDGGILLGSSASVN